MTDAPVRPSRRLREARMANRPPRAAATAMALGIIFALAYVFVIRTPPQLPTPDLREARGTYTVTRSPVAGQTGRSPLPVASGAFAAWASGDATGAQRRAAAPTSGDEARRLRSSYDARTRTTVTTSTFAGRDVTTRTIGAWPPAWQVATPSPLDYQGLTAIVRSGIEDKDSTVGIKPFDADGRRVWRAAMTFPGDDLVEVVVDQQSGLVTWHSETWRGSTETFTAIPAWEASSTPSPEAVDAPGQATDIRLGGDRSRERSVDYAPSLAAAGRVAGFAPLASDLAPDGFALKAVATADIGGAPGTWLAGDASGMPPIDPLVGQLQVDQFYTRGLTSFSVRQLGPRAASAAAAALGDTVRSLAAGKLSLKTTSLQYGALAGRTAYTWYEKSGPTLFASDSRHVVFITGALTRQELVSFAEGLEPLGGPPGSPSPSP